MAQQWVDINIDEAFRNVAFLKIGATSPEYHFHVRKLRKVSMSSVEMPSFEGKLPAEFRSNNNIAETIALPVVKAVGYRFFLPDIDVLYAFQCIQYRITIGRFSEDARRISTYNMIAPFFFNVFANLYQSAVRYIGHTMVSCNNQVNFLAYW